jgi:hypothetical protein
MGVSSTLFKKLELSGTFDNKTKVFPETWFNNLALSETLEQVLPDGRVILDIKDDNNLPLISMTLYGRNFHMQKSKTFKIYQKYQKNIKKISKKSKNITKKKSKKIPI